MTEALTATAETAQREEPTQSAGLTLVVRAARSRPADVLRVLAMAGVVLLHTVAPSVSSFSASNTQWWVANLLDSLARPSVPLFFMLSGALALRVDVAEAPWRALRKRAIAFWRPALLWMLVYWVWDEWREHKSWNASSTWRTLVLGETHYHLWYVWVAGGLFFAFPIVARWWTSATEGEKRYALVWWFALAVVAPLATRVAFGYPQRLEFLVFGGYAGFLVLGAWLATRRTSAHETRVLLLAGAVGFTMTAVGTAWLRQWAIARAASATIAAGGKHVAPHFDERFYGYLTPNVVVMAVAWWVLVAPNGLLARRGEPPNASQRERRVPDTLLPWLADASYPVYLAHPLVLEGATRLFPALARFTGDARYAPIVALGALMVALAGVAIGSRLPILRLWMPMARRVRLNALGA